MRGSTHVPPDFLVMKPSLTLFLLTFFCWPGLIRAEEAIPAIPPRTWVLSGQREALREFCLRGAGAEAYSAIARDYRKEYSRYTLPPEPAAYGDPDPSKRTPDKVDLWRGVQDVCGEATAVAEAAWLVWAVEGDAAALAHAKGLVLSSCQYDPEGVTGISYNDEGHFRLWRKLPALYDQLREHFSPEERQTILAHFRQRGNLSVRWIREAGTAGLRRNSLEPRPSSHPVRFMAMTGLSGLALWDDVPEAREWFHWALAWYADRFPMWGGDDGGWAEGPAYWRGVYEHAIFQDALLLLGRSDAYATEFWRATGYFQVYLTQPYRATTFGDLSNAGKFNMEPGVKHFLTHLARVLQDGYLLQWTQLYEDPRPLPDRKGLGDLNRLYPTSAEYLLRDFLAAKLPLPPPQPLSRLSPNRYFQDIGWVSFHSSLGQPDEDIHLTFKSSPYGSYSHSHADQNSFILNAFRANLAINSGYREYHRSAHHKGYTWQTFSKNNITINGQGQKPQDANAKGKILRFVEKERLAWTTGDSAAAYNANLANPSVIKNWRDVVFVDQRYFVIRDHVILSAPGTLEWYLHAQQPMTIEADRQSVLIRENGVGLAVRLHSEAGPLALTTWTGFPVPVDPKYRDAGFVQDSLYLRATCVDQAHFSARSSHPSVEMRVYAVLWPDRDPERADLLELDREGDRLLIRRPDGQVDRLLLTDSRCEIE